MTNLASRKLKVDKGAISRFLISLFLTAVILYVIIVVLDAASWGPGFHSFDYMLLGLYTLLGTMQLVLFFKSRNRASLGLGIALLLFIPYLFISLSVYSDLRYLFYIVWAGIFFICGPLRRRSNPHYRQVLELAGRSVDEIKNGFTQRPFPAGTWKYSREEIINFGRFLMKHWIATTYVEKERVVLAVCGFSWRYLLFGRKDFQKMTALSFDFSGHVAVNITKADYRKFRDQLTFEQLCAALGDLIRQFLMFYQAGEEQKILEIIDGEMSRSHWFFSKFTAEPPDLSARTEG